MCSSLMILWVGRVPFNDCLQKSSREMESSLTAAADCALFQRENISAQLLAAISVRIKSWQ